MTPSLSPISVSVEFQACAPHGTCMLCNFQDLKLEHLLFQSFLMTSQVLSLYFHVTVDLSTQYFKRREVFKWKGEPDFSGPITKITKSLTEKRGFSWHRFLFPLCYSRENFAASFLPFPTYPQHMHFGSENRTPYKTLYLNRIDHVNFFFTIQTFPHVWYCLFISYRGWVSFLCLFLTNSLMGLYLGSNLSDLLFWISDWTTVNLLWF